MGFFATADARMATPGSDSTAISNVLKDGEMMDFSADWQNTEEAPATPGDLVMGSVTVECSVGVRVPTEVEIVKNGVQSSILNVSLDSSMSPAASADLELPTAVVWASTEESTFPVLKRSSLETQFAWNVKMRNNKTKGFATTPVISLSLIPL